MSRNENLYQVETSKSSAQFANDFQAVCKKHAFVVNNSDSMSMKKPSGLMAERFLIILICI
jgi:hypothetical protein